MFYISFRTRCIKYTYLCDIWIFHTFNRIMSDRSSCHSFETFSTRVSYGSFHFLHSLIINSFTTGDESRRPHSCLSFIRCFAISNFLFDCLRTFSSPIFKSFSKKYHYHIFHYFLFNLCITHTHIYYMYMCMYVRSLSYYYIVVYGCVQLSECISVWAAVTTNTTTGV